MPRSATVAVPRRLSFELEDAHPRTAPSEGSSSPTGPREYDSWPCDSFFLLPDAVLEMDAGAFRADLNALDPVLSASLPEWLFEEPGINDPLHLYMTPSHSPGNSPHLRPRAASRDRNRPDRRSFTLLDNHEGLTVRSFGKGTVLIGGGGGDGSGGSSSNAGGVSYISSPSMGGTVPSATNGPSDPSMLHNSHRATTPTSKQDPTQKDRSSGLCYKDREERVRQLRERQQTERQQKLEELKEQAASAQRFREQQEAARRLRLEDMRSKDSERRTQVEERKKIIQQAEQERRVAVLRKSAEREQRLEHKRRQERSNAVFAFGSSTPRMLDPKETISIQNYWGARRATSTTNVNMSDSGTGIRRSSECHESDLSRKRATSAHSLNRKPDGDDPMTRSLIATTSTAARRRTDLMPAVPSLRDTTSARGSPRHRSPGFRSGTGTPNSPSRPTSALSQASGGSQVVLRNRTSPKKPRPLSIAGSTPSSADKPREPGSSIASPASPNRESRSIDRKSSTGNGPTKLVRAKSVSSDRSAPLTPAKTPSRGTTPKRTPAQVKAESAARKAAEKSKATLKLKSTPKTTPLQSPSVESKLLPGTDKKTVNNKSTPKEIAKPLKEPSSTDLKEDISKDNLTEAQPKDLETEVIESVVSTKEVETIIQEEISDISTIQVLDQNATLEVKSEPVIEVSVESVVVEKVVETNIESEANVELEKSSVEVSNTTVEQVEPLQKATNGSTTAKDEEKAMVQRASEKPVTGYATEEEYKVALAEKRRKAREAKEREIELERQRQLEEEERERREEEEYLKLMEDQKKVEEERLKKAIEEAEKLRQEEILKKEEEEKQRIENERIELEKRKEAEEKARKEEEERLMRKSRVAQIMSRTRGSKGGNSPQSKIESKTPSDESKTMNDSLNAVNMSESFISSLSSSMTDSMIAQAIESRDSTQQKSPLSQQIETVVVDSVSECSSQPHSDLSSQPLSDVSSQANSSVELDYSQPSSGIHSDSSSMQSSIQITQEEAIVAQTNTEELQSTPTPAVELLSNVEATPFQFENTFHLNGNSPITMETTTMIQNIDLLGSFNGVNGINHNGVESQLTKPDNDFGSLDPLNLQSSVTFTSKGEANFDQIIDINQTKLSNEDAVNSNNPHPPFIAFEDNLNRKQSQDSSNVPDLLL